MTQSIPKLRKRKKIPANQMVSPEMVEMNLARRSIYQFLTRIFSWEINKVFLQRFKLPMVKTLLKDLGWKLELDFKKKSDEELVEELILEYTQLFLGPDPHKSVHNVREDGEDGKLWGQSTIEVQNFIETSGLKFTGDFKGLPDHIGVELEFLRHIAEKEQEALEKNSFDDVVTCLKLSEQFISEHLLTWIESFTKQIKKQAKIPFYYSAAVATLEVLQFDQKQLSDLIGTLNTEPTTF